MAVFPQADKDWSFGPQAYAPAVRDSKVVPVETSIEWRHCPDCQRRYGIAVSQRGVRCDSCAVLLVRGKGN